MEAWGVLRTFAGEIHPVVVAFLGPIIAYLGVRIAVRNKQTDVTMIFHKQFDALQAERARILAVSSATPTATRAQITEAQIFYDRFWSLQFDQFVAWYDGYVPTRLYQYWVYSKWKMMRGGNQSDSALSGLSFGDSVTGRSDLQYVGVIKRWAQSEVANAAHSRHVQRFVGLLKEMNESETWDKGWIDRAGPSWVIRMARKFIGAY